MKKTIQAIILCSISLSALAAEPPFDSMIGEWVGVSNSSVLGPDPHHQRVTPDAVEFRHKEFTYTFTKQEGRNFAGTMKSVSRTEPIVGVIRSDRKNGFIVDTDGVALFTLLDKNRIELCYTQTLVSGSSMVASCFELNRK